MTLLCHFIQNTWPELP